MPVQPLKSYLALCKPNCSPPGSSIHRIFLARILKWVVISSSRESYQPRDQTCVSCTSCTGRQILYHCATWKKPLERIPCCDSYENPWVLGRCRDCAFQLWPSLWVAGGADHSIGTICFVSCPGFLPFHVPLDRRPATLRRVIRTL